jgi:VanZ family protein
MSCSSLPKKKKSSESEGSLERPGASPRLLLAAWIPVVLLEAVVLFLSSRPNLHLPHAIPNLDKGAHFLEYAALGGLLYRALRLQGAGRGRSVLASLLLAGGLGAADENFQRLIPGRTCSLSDWTADFLGALAGSVFMRAMERNLPARLWTLGARGPRLGRGRQMQKGTP